MTDAMTDAEQRMPVAVWEGSFTVLGVSLRCHVLDDGRRIINADDAEALLTRLADASAMPAAGEYEAFARWMAGPFMRWMRGDTQP